ncbi:hypothetical protein C1H46_045688 [Malus baccata]|uniref:Uncharacterized protein n=1 Tax=Malus baccata TaxID=106549 RepID=A0A540K3E9_MALBA|nr:hypothetical protein C1H46_045688 [Malus baccata]
MKRQRRSGGGGGDGAAIVQAPRFEVTTAKTLAVANKKAKKAIDKDGKEEFEDRRRR